MRRILLLTVVLSFFASACSAPETANPLIGIRASTDSAVGDNRLLFAVHEISGVRRGGPDEAVSVVASPLDSPDVKYAADATYVPIIDGVTGLYVVHIPFDTAGIWQIDFTVSTGEDTDSFLVDIKEQPLSVAIGEMAPAVATPTLAQFAIKDLTTDPNPLLSMYQMSLDVALTNGQKSVVVFSTPAYCTSSACGPMLDQVKDMVTQFPEVNFLHIEVYEGFRKAGFAPDENHLAPSVVAFGLASEPWVFVVDETGAVSGRFDGVLADGEIESLLRN